MKNAGPLALSEIDAILPGWNGDRSLSMPRRMMIVGPTAAGKSILAQVLGKRTGLPVHHLDLIEFEQGMAVRPADDRVAVMSKIEAEDQWIIEGGFGLALKNRLDRAKMVVWLDLPKLVRFGRRLKRVAQSMAGVPVHDRSNTLAEELSPRNLWHNFGPSRPIRQIIRFPLTKHPDKVIRLCNRRAIARFQEVSGEWR